MEVIIEKYNPSWKTQFLELKEHLHQALANTPIISIEHVGSTSIPSMRAKPVIDIINPPSSLPAARRALADRYTGCGEVDVPGRFAFRQPGDGRYDAAHGLDRNGRNGRARYNTYLMIYGCTALRNHLDVSRVLLEDGQIREEYAKVKDDPSQQEFEHIGQYVAETSEILIKILRRAGWSEGDLEAVIQVNR